MTRTLAAAYGVRAIDLLTMLSTGYAFTSSWWTQACIDNRLAPEHGAALLRDLLLEEAVVSGRPLSAADAPVRFVVALDPLTITVRQR